jgi:hypothetical protein
MRSEQLRNLVMEILIGTAGLLEECGPIRGIEVERGIEDFPQFADRLSAHTST